MAKRSQPPWNIDAGSPKPGLHLYNSLTRKKEIFIPKNGNKVLWYSCGPTVYDASHMGHARSYITFDIIRRVLSDYFGYNVLYVMNITDIDDKIIKRARIKHLLKTYFDGFLKMPIEEVLKDVKKILEYEHNKIDKTQGAAKHEELGRLAQLTCDIDTSMKMVDSALKDNNKGILYSLLKDILLKAESPLGELLDKQYSSSIEDNKIFSELPRFWEERFLEDMSALNVLPPHVLTRVSEYVPEIIGYIGKIMENGLAYESNGSVYFDVAAFNSKPNHSYAKLVPEAYENLELLEEGEGELSEHKEKRQPTDFALWKASKPGEPWWDSPWGQGRPGWHIECSVMASEICGDSLDIHTGGVDLKFPHHDNEIAQAEAYFDNDLWVRYFLHSGHLTISGCKMSKSLKNFITIADALEDYSSRQIRFAFLLHSWGDTLDYSKNSMDVALSYEKMFSEFFLNVKDVINSFISSNISDGFQKWSNAEKDLNKVFLVTKEAVHFALCDNIDTRSCLGKIKECITKCNIYLKGSNSNVHLVKDIAVYVTQILKIFGVISEKEDIGFPLLKASNSNNIEGILMPYLKLLGEFRDEVRLKAKEIKNKEILELCDSLRDSKLIELGVRLEDREGKPSAIKLVDKETLLKEKEEKERVKLEKEKAKAEKLSKLAEKEAQKKINPSEMFLRMTDKYSAFDDDGLPTHDSVGKEISKNLLSKLKKLQAHQKVLYESSNGEFPVKKIERSIYYKLLPVIL